MDYSKLLFALEVRKLAINWTNAAAPKDLSAEERETYVRDNFAKSLSAVMGEIQYAAKLVDQELQKPQD